MVSTDTLFFVGHPTGKPATLYLDQKYTCPTCCTSSPDQKAPLVPLMRSELACHNL